MYKGKRPDLLIIRRIRPGNPWPSVEIGCVCALFKAYRGESARKTIGHRLLEPRCLSRGNHACKIGGTKQRTDIGKYFFVNRIIELWNQLPSDVPAIFSCKKHNIGKGARKV
jgi:hypothetical protein